MNDMLANGMTVSTRAQPQLLMLTDKSGPAVDGDESMPDSCVSCKAALLGNFPQRSWLCLWLPNLRAESSSLTGSMSSPLSRKPSHDPRRRKTQESVSIMIQGCRRHLGSAAREKRMCKLQRDRERERERERRETYRE